MTNKKGKPYSNMNKLYWLASIDLSKDKLQGLLFSLEHITFNSCFKFKFLSKKYLTHLKNTAFNYNIKRARLNHYMNELYSPVTIDISKKSC